MTYGFLPRQRRVIIVLESIAEDIHTGTSKRESKLACTACVTIDRGRRAQVLQAAGFRVEIQRGQASRRGMLHFAKGKTPPVDGFWSITMYDASYYFYLNAQNKPTVSMRDHPALNPDGSLDLYFSHDKPAKAPEANWLSAPSDQFILMMRMYWPKETPPSILDGTRSPPPVKKAG